MNILFHTEYFYPSIGGIERFTRNVSTFLHEKGFNIRVLTETPHTDEGKFPFPVYRNPDGATVRRLVREADLVYMNGHRTDILLYAGLFAKKTVSVYHDVTMICPKGNKVKDGSPCTVNMCFSECAPCLKKSGELKVFRRLLRPHIKTLLSSFISANVCTSQFAMEEYQLSNKRLIEHGVDTSFFVPDNEKSDTEHIRLLFVGRLVREKGCQLLLRSVKKLLDKGNEVALSVCGDGEFRPQLERLTDRLELRDAVTFHGELQGESLVHIMQQADISVVPSWIEQFGLTAVEAMSCGLPVVGSKVGGLRRIVEEGGLGFERGKLDELTKHLEHLIQHPEMREEMGREARQLAVEKYSLQRMYTQHLQLIEELVEK